MKKILLFVLLLVPSLALAVSVGGPVRDNVEIQCDLPVDERIKNIGSHIDGAGMCVMSSIEMAARWQGMEQFRGLRDWCARQPGGGYPSKVDKQIQQFCQAKNLSLPGYTQEENISWERVKKVLDSGRVACVTYAGKDGIRYSGPIAHMVCVVHCDSQRVAILDNNAIGENELLWMTPQEFDVRFKEFQSRGGWLFYWHAPAPPPVPRSRP